MIAPVSDRDVLRRPERRGHLAGEEVLPDRHVEDTFIRRKCALGVDDLPGVLMRALVGPEVVRAELLADAALGPFHYWIRRAGRLSRKLSSSVARVFENCRNPEAVESNQIAASV